MRRVGQRVGLVEAQDDAAVFVVGALQPVQLPPLALVAAQVVYVEGAIGLAGGVQLALDLDQALAAGVDGVAPQVHPDPAPAQLLRHCQRCATAAEEVSDNTIFSRGGAYNTTN